MDRDSDFVCLVFFAVKNPTQMCLESASSFLT